ncbi:MAG: hypothetical protein IKN12_01065 [Selenomonadaceae bacterium]|nr:hypothetical protein [Selenomonadaceae bacterium]
MMNYTDYPYNIFNQNSLLNYGKQNINDYQQYHVEQQKNIVEMRKAIRDYCEAARKVSPEYQQIAIDQCLQEILIQANKS